MSVTPTWSSRALSPQRASQRRKPVQRGTSASIALGALCAMLHAGDVHAEDTAGKAGKPGAAPWVTVEEVHGVTVSKRENAGKLPGFRGQGVVRGNVLRILSLLLDVDAVPKWAYGVDEAHMVGKPTERADTVYLYSDVAWPVRDRDMIVRRQVEVLEPGKHFRITLSCMPDAEPERSGVVRVRDCDSTFELVARDAEHTHVDYAMTLDPAGYLPKWAGAWVAKHVPLKTLESIESQADGCGKRYEAAMRRWSSAL